MTAVAVVTNPEPPASDASATAYRTEVVRQFGGRLTLEQTPMRALAAGQVRVKVEACGPCHTDIHAANGGWPIKPSPPANYVVKVPEGVDSLDAAPLKP